MRRSLKQGGYLGYFCTFFKIVPQIAQKKSSSSSSKSSNSCSSSLVSSETASLVLLGQSRQEQRPVHLSSAFLHAQRLVEQAELDLHPQFTFSRIQSGAAGNVIQWTSSFPSFIFHPNPVIGGADRTDCNALFQMHAWYDARLVCRRSASLVHGMDFWPQLNKLKRARLTSSVWFWPYNRHTYIWIFLKSSSETPYVEPSDWKVVRNAGYFSKVPNVFTFPFEWKALVLSQP